MLEDVRLIRGAHYPRVGSSTIADRPEAHGRRVPAQYHINHEDEFVAIRLEGDVDLVEVYELCQSLLGDPRLQAAAAATRRRAQHEVEADARRTCVRF